MVSFRDWFFGRKGKQKNLDVLTPEQQQLQQQTIGGVSQGLPQGFEYLMQILNDDPEAMNQFFAPYMQQFEQEIVPGIAERFAGMGTGGAQDSSAFQQTMGRAGKEFATQLASMRQGLKSQALQQLQNLMNPAMQPSFYPSYQPETTGYGYKALENLIDLGTGAATGGGIPGFRGMNQGVSSGGMSRAPQQQTNFWLP